MTITASELKNNLGKYIELAETKDIYVTKNGQQRKKISSTKQRSLSFVGGIFKDIDISNEDIKWERLGNV